MDIFGDVRNEFGHALSVKTQYCLLWILPLLLPLLVLLFLLTPQAIFRSSNWMTPKMKGQRSALLRFSENIDVAREQKDNAPPFPLFTPGDFDPELDDAQKRII